MKWTISENVRYFFLWYSIRLCACVHVTKMLAAYSPASKVQKPTAKSQSMAFKRLNIVISRFIHPYTHCYRTIYWNLMKLSVWYISNGNNDDDDSDEQTITTTKKKQFFLSWTHEGSRGCDQHTLIQQHWV